MKRIAAFVLILLLFLSFTQYGFAADSEEQHINYIKEIFNEEKGMPSGEANAVAQTRDGYLWFGSYSGLIRYDGSTMKDFSDHLENTAIRALYAASDGALYIGTNGAAAYVLREDEFCHLQAEDERSFLSIRGFAEGQDGTIYLASPSGVAKVMESGLQPFSYSELDGVQVLKVAVDGFDNVWAMSDNGDVLVFNETQFLARYSSTEFFLHSAVSAICNDTEGNIYLGSSSNEILKLTSKDAFASDSLKNFSRTRFSSGETVTINSLDPVRDGTVLVSALNGFGFLDNEGVYHQVDSDSVNNLSANGAALDGEGNRWVASSNYGIVRYSVGCFDSCNYNSNLGEFTVNGVAKQGNLFYLVTDEGLMLFDENWCQVENELTRTLHGIRIRNVTVDTQGRVWMATYSSHGALCYDPSTGETTDFGMEQGLNSEKIRVVYALSDGRMLVGNQSGINIIEAGKVTESYGREEGMETTSVLCAMELNGRVYVGTDGSGIYEITKNGLVNLSFDQGLTEGVVLRMEPDADGNGNYFVCASDKLFYCEKESFRLLSNFRKDSGSIFSIYDVDGTLWILQNGGVFAVDKAGVLAGTDVYTAEYGVKCGLTGTLSANTWCWLEDRALYIPTRSGVSVFHFQGPEVPVPRAILNSVLVDDTLYEHPTVLNIPRNTQRITIDVSQLLFSDTAEFNMGYYLEGFDTKVSFTTEKHVSVSYTNLRGGSYAFKVRVYNPLTGESTAEKVITIIKQKRLVEYTWFYIVCGLFGAICIEEFIRLYLRRKTKLLMKRQEEQLHFIDEITQVFSKCIDMRDHYTNGHSARVAKYTVLLAKKLGKNEEEVARMYHIALLHDVGKISIPDAVLNKPERLTDEEYAEMKSHAQRGYEVLKDMDFFPELALGAGCHHERYDGKGYPQGLKGEEIPEVAQIIAVADTFDAMYSTRPYRKKMELSTVVDEIRRGSGTQFSPKVVDAFLQLADEGAFDNE